MAKLARLPGFHSAPDPDANAARVPRLRTRYYAFLSYSHKDKSSPTGFTASLNGSAFPARWRAG